MAKRAGKRVKAPTVLQMETAECGAASLAMVLGFYGRHENLETLRAACGVSRDGSRAGNILRAARSYGLDAKGFRMETQNLRNLTFPAILFWNFDHYLVLEGFRGDTVYVNDPAVGRRELPIEEFDRFFTGVVLTFAPSPQFRKGGARPRPFLSLLSFLGGSRAAVAYLALVTLLLAIPSLAVPAFARIFVDDVLIGGNRSWLRGLLAAMCAAGVLIAGLTALQQKGFLLLERRLSLIWGSRLMWRTLILPVEFYAHRSAAEIATRLRLPERVASLLSGELATNAVNVLLTGFYAAVMFQYDAVLASVACAMALLNIAALQAMARRGASDYARLSQELGNLHGAVSNQLASIETLKASGHEATAFGTLAGKYTLTLAAEQKLLISTRLMAVFPGLISSTGAAVVFAVGGWRVMDGVLSAGMLVAFQTLVQSFLQPINRLMILSGEGQQIAADSTRLNDIFRHEPDPLADDDRSDDDQYIRGEVQLLGVTFGYSPLDPPLIEDFNLRISPGSRVALVGVSGSGKSTIARLISGLYRPWKGEVLVDGRPLEAIPRRIRAQAIAVVEQNPFFLEGTVRQNVTLWDSTIDDAAVDQSLHDACLASDIRSRAEGMNSMVEEGGRNWSGGQRQRLEIARALAGNPRILVLDEATSALDPVTEKKVDDHIRRRGCSCLIIAHRLSTIRDSDEIVVLDKGKVVERGTHAELMALHGAYARLVTSY